MNFQDALTFRHACKLFDETKTINQNDFNTILEAGRMAPSSFGLEPWQIEVIRSKDLKAAIRPPCWGQVQITSCSELLVIYARIADLIPTSEHIKMLFSRKAHHSPEQVNMYIAKYTDYFKRYANEREIFGWSRAQCYICAQNMMMQAAILGIDSCAIEGYEEDELNKVLGVDTNKRRVAMLLTLGYRVNEAQEKIRLNLDQIVSYR